MFIIITTKFDHQTKAKQMEMVHANNRQQQPTGILEMAKVYVLGCSSSRVQLAWQLMFIININQKL